MRRFSFCYLLLALALAGCGQQENAKTDTKSNAESTAAGAIAAEMPTGPLPKDVVPQHYDIQLTMDPDAESFSGHTEIRIELNRPRDVIWLHGWELRMDKAAIELADGSTLPATYEQVNDAGLVKLSLPETVEPQFATLVFDYTADFFSGLDGAYRVEAGGDWYVFTQFEPTHARRVFPGFDEPAFKTPYNLQFTIPESDKMVTTTPVTDTETLDSGMQQLTFAETKPLPTYLIAFAIGPLDIVEAAPIPPNDVRDRPVPLRGVAVQGKGEQMRYALEHTGELLAIMEEYFQIPYPFQKIDIIAVPDFSGGAMENVGVITFRDVYLLIPDPEKAPTWQLHAYVEVMAHELAHQWFGNLVTMPWWDDLWLNEASATWMEAKTVEIWNAEHPTEQGIAGTIARAMNADSLANARQIRQPVESHHDIENAFDGITYSKGGSVILMFEKYLGEDVFRDAIQYHLDRFAFGNANVFDFLESLSHISGKDIAPAFKSFLFQPGIPLVNVDVNCAEGKPAVTLSQSRYLPLGSKGDSNLEWDLPVCLKYGTESGVQEECVMLDEKQASFELSAQSCPAWVMPNAGGVGYYHWTLDDAGYADLLEAADKLDMMELLAVERSIKAAFAAGRMDTDAALDALAPLTDSDHFEVAEAPMSIVAMAKHYLVEDALKDEVAAYARELYSDYSLAEEFKPGKAPADATERDHHVSVARFLAEQGEVANLREAATQAGHALTGFGGDGEVHLDAVSPDYMSLALNVAVEESGAEFFEHLVTLFKTSENPLIRRTILGALGGATEPALTARIQELLLDPELKRNEVPRLLYSYAGEPENRVEAWNWLREHYDEVTALMAPDHASSLPFIAGGFCSTERAAEVQDFFADRVKELPGGPRNLAKAIEGIELCAAQKAAQSDSANAFFGGE
ncbi:MAG TPA: M1 family metallopeptidase [Gammaproteobacteria bacterium]